MRRILVCLGIAACLSACASPQLNFEITTADQLNTDIEMNSYAVLVRIYQLNTPELFEQADYKALWKTDEQVLGATLVSRHELTLEPNQHLNFSLPKSEETRYTGVVAFFRQYDQGGWMATRKVNFGVIPASTELTLDLAGNNLELSYQ